MKDNSILRIMVSLMVLLPLILIILNSNGYASTSAVDLNRPRQR
jgi:hypothetical protein